MPVRDECFDDTGHRLDAVPVTSAVSEVAKRLLTYVTSGDIPPGTRLPSERSLAAMLNTGRSAVREAMAALEILGVVEIKPGSGTYLRGTASELLPDTLSWGLLIGEAKTSELLELRQGMEAHCAALAAQRADEQACATLATLLRQMRESMDDLPQFVEADMRFHQELAQVARNEVLSGLLFSVRSLLRVWMERRLTEREHAVRAVEEHAAVLDAVNQGDAGGAFEAMQAHMRTASKRVAEAKESGGGLEGAEHGG